MTTTSTPALPATIDTTKPLPADIRAWIREYGGPLMKAMLNEMETLHTRLNVETRALNSAHARIRELETDARADAAA